MIGLFFAITGFDFNKETSFKTFANLIITRQIQSAIKNANRKKHIPLNSSISLSENNTNNLENIFSEISDEEISNPEILIIEEEEIENLKLKLKNILSSLEYKVFNLYLEGNSYKEISIKLNKTEKSIDNAIQRIKNKASTLIN